MMDEKIAEARAMLSVYKAYEAEFSDPNFNKEFVLRGTQGAITLLEMFIAALEARDVTE